MKQATSEFKVDNGTVFEGQVLPDSHPAVVRFPENFTEVKDGDDIEGQAVADMSSGETVEDSDDGAKVDETPDEKTDTAKHAAGSSSKSGSTSSSKS